MKENQARPAFQPMWRAEQKAGDKGTLDVYIYGDVEAEVWEGGWWDGYWAESENSANHFRELLEEHRDAVQINVYINSLGGSVMEGTAIYNQLRRHPAHKTVFIDAFACSIASVIAMAGDEVVMPRNALMMIHNMWSCCCGNAAELRKAADDLDRINAAGRQAYLVKAGDRLSEDKLVEMMDASTWLTAEDCIAFGLADRYADTDAEPGRAEEAVQRANINLEQRIAMHRCLSARLRELSETGTPQNTPETRQTAREAPEVSVPIPKPESGWKGTAGAQAGANGIMRMFQAF